jgi:hypothetical protein
MPVDRPRKPSLLRPSIPGVDEPPQVSPLHNTAAVRLVGLGDREHADAERSVAQANRLASGMRPDDARWVLALKVSQALEGGRAAILTPERRQALLTHGRRIGLRDFDANLLIAIVQDGKRSGRGALHLAVEERLAALPEPGPIQPTNLWPWAIAAMILAATLLFALQNWITGPLPIP